MIFVPSSANDIERYYLHTYVKFQETGDRLFFIEGVSKHKVSGTCDDDTPFDLYLSDEFPYEVSYVLPNKSYFQVNEHAYLMERKPAKQYKRGLCGENVSISRHRGGTEFMNCMIGFGLLKAFVAKQAFYTLKDAFLNADKKSSVAVSSRMMYVPKGGRLFIDKTQIATIRGHKGTSAKTIELHQPIFREEVEAVMDKQFFTII